MIGAAASLGACASRGRDPQKPAALLSSSLGAEGELRRLIGEWARASKAERIAMEGAIQTLRRAHPKDPAARAADVLLAWIALDRGEDAVAAERAREAAEAAGTGSFADVARTVRGAALRRQGQPEAALALLEPLVSKLVDGWARALLNEEVVESAVRAGKWQRTLELMSVWLREAGTDERASVRAHIERDLERLPAGELTRWLGRERGIELAQAAEEELEIRRLVAQRLAMVARAEKDAELAHQLLAGSGTLLGDHSDAIAQLAAGANRARVEARTVGLLLSLRNEKTRRRGAQIADGVAFGLGLPGSRARLVSRDDHGSAERLEEALAALSADGASIVIAGSDEQEAGVAATFAEQKQIPVILLRPPAPGTAPPGKLRFSFVVGVDLIELESMLVSALASRGASPVAILADEPVSPRAPRPEVTSLRGCNDASAPWKPLGVLGVVLSAHPECARAAVIAGAPQRLRFAASFEADAAALPAGSVTATAGLYPIALGSKPKPLEAWIKAHASAPSWWVALGRDAAVLAWAGVQGLPPQGTEDPHEVALRRAMAASAVASAQVELWTTEATGFGGGRALQRAIGVREVGR